MKTNDITRMISSLEEQLANQMSKEIAMEIDKELMIEMTKNWPEDLRIKKMDGGYFALPYGWAGELAIPNTTNFDDHWQKYLDIVKWINDNIKNPKQNACWTKIGDCIYVYIRKPKDWTWFVLRWSA